MDDGGTIKLELYPDKAPNTVANFVALIQEGFYDGLTFHRTSAEFMIQGGDPNGSGTGGPGYAIAGEFAANGFPRNDLSHERGVLSMARSNDYDSAGSQFFIMTVDMTGLDGQYAAFGRVVEGMDVADGIAAGPNTGAAGNYMALEPRTMQSVTVDTFGQAYTAEKK
ncbi:MAG: peptidylprolyl isomerase [Oscillospiraceae bacterium]|nr:peptidylprolyl isomerase [Oscillospiraceae bacterium]